MLRLSVLCMIGTSLMQQNCRAQKDDSLMLRKITNDILLHGQCYPWLGYMCNKIGPRLSGSPQAAAAVEYVYQLMKSLHADTVYKQDCMVPHWIRGDKETAKILTDNAGEFSAAICALGGSVATPPEGITAKVAEVDSWDELKQLGTAGRLKGKIVFYNRPFDETLVQTFAAYGKAVDQRVNGPSAAARYGAVATIVRSMTNRLDDNPHTGNMGYNDSLPKVPCCAISTIGAEQLHRLLKADTGLRFYFKMDCQTLPDEKSSNVVGEIKGSRHPEQIIVIGGHLDSWDLAQGANDDGSGVMQSIEVLRVFKALGIRPERTIRVVAFMNEENGDRGGQKYAELAKLHHEKTIAAIESDAGGFSPRGFGITGEPKQRKEIQAWEKLFYPYGVYDFTGEGGGTDIDPLKDQGTILIGLLPDSQRYFDIHHSAMDTFENVNKRELELGAASLAMMAYLISEQGL
ncbi:MAG: M20/M25/M40 family metallo-hydrolase [Bacteroidia bacterium]|nr:M20/M25/M40 family metallo-hydrolase [Bacteroidia bacterium]